MKHRLSLFADDVVLLIQPSASEAAAALQLLIVFGMASGNLNKSSVSPIRCEGLNLQPVLDVLDCPLKQFPITYLGLPLSSIRLTKNQL